MLKDVYDFMIIEQFFYHFSMKFMFAYFVYESKY